MTEELLYYLEDFSDEILPCAPTLAAWAQWLSAPDPEWSRDEPAKPGDVFGASVMLELPDVVVRQVDGEWSVENVPEADFYAIRWGPGLGWGVDDIAADREDLRRMIIEDGHVGVVHVAVGVNKPSVRLRYDESEAGPRLEIMAEQS